MGVTEQELRVEHWALIEEFPDYEVSDLGSVRNAHTGRILGIYDNGHGVMQVVMNRDRRKYCRAVHRLVAEAFLDPAPDDCIPIHIDEDWTNNEASNLVWKPRWFAVKRTQQSRRTEPRDIRPVLMVKTGVVYDNALVCAKEIGGLEELVLLTAQNRHGATYFGSAFEFYYG